MNVKIHSGPLKGGNNSGSCSALLNYLEKEDKGRGEENELKGFFNANSSHLSNDQAKEIIEHQFYKKGVGKNDDKFFSVTMSFSQDELKGRSNKELQEFAQEKFASMYCNSTHSRKTDPDPSKLAWVAKLETERRYKGDDKEVKKGLVKSGDSKEGDQRHIHFVVARKMLDDKAISPGSKSREGKSTGAASGGFDRDHIKFECEKEFDKRFNYERKEEEKVKNTLGDYRPDLVEKFYSKEIEQEKQREQQAKEKFNESQKAIEKTFTIWDKVKESFDKAKEAIVKVVSPIQKLLDRANQREQEQKEAKEKPKSIFEQMEQKRQESQESQNKEKDKEQDKDRNSGLTRGL